MNKRLRVDLNHCRGRPSSLNGQAPHVTNRKLSLCRTTDSSSRDYCKTSELKAAFERKRPSGKLMTLYPGGIVNRPEFRCSSGYLPRTCILRPPLPPPFRSRRSFLNEVCRITAEFFFWLKIVSQHRETFKSALRIL